MQEITLDFNRDNFGWLPNYGQYRCRNLNLPLKTWSDCIGLWVHEPEKGKRIICYIMSDHLRLYSGNPLHSQLGTLGYPCDREHIVNILRNLDKLEHASDILSIKHHKYDAIYHAN